MKFRLTYVFLLIIFFNKKYAQQTFAWNTYTVQTLSGTITNSCVNMAWSITTSGAPNWANSTPKYANSLGDGTGLKINGPMTLYQYSTISLVWDGTLWAEMYRRV